MDTLAAFTVAYGAHPPLSGYPAHGPRFEAAPSIFDSRFDAGPSTLDARLGAPVREPPQYTAPIGHLGPAQFGSPAVAASSTTSPVHFAHNLPVKLTPDNYLFWRAQIAPLLRSHSLECFVDGTCPCPSPAHPSHRLWIAQDQAILSALQASLSEGVAGLVLFATTARDV
jgi:hypothetical protein